MSKLLLSSYMSFFRKSLWVLSLATVSLFVISDETILINAESVEIDLLLNRLIDVTNGLNESDLLEFIDYDDYTAYQSKAFLRLSQQVGVDDFTDAKIAQYYALYCIYYATNAVANSITDEDVRFQNITMPEWLVAENWRDETNVDPCGGTTITPTNGTTETSIAATLFATSGGGWYGVTCDAEGRVVALELYRNILTGTLPEEIVLLASDGPFSTGAGNLGKLDLFKNEFLSNGGDSSWMSNLGSNMTTIIVEGTGFSGDIPLLPENLVNFNIRNAFYTGGLTDGNFAFASRLNYLNLDGNMFNTSIPVTLRELPDLEYVYMSDNLLVGDLSPLEGSPAIMEFWADGNPSLTGPLFSWLGSMTTLASLSLAYNNLTGSIPVEFGNLIKMEQMWLQFNGLTGTVPTELGKMTLLRHLELESNAFTGVIHASICNNTEGSFWVPGTLQTEGSFLVPGTLQTVGADCFDLWCPCCTCCDLKECVSGVHRSPSIL